MGIFDRFPYSSTHEMNLDFMLGKATEIAEDMQTVATGMAQVQAGLSAISEKTEQATQAAAQAAQSASSIEGSVTAAEEAAEEAQMHNESAQTWANNAMTYKADCQRSATEAAASATSAAQAATAAAGSEDTVAQYAQAANASAQSAANNNDSAHQYANQASASASNATFHSSNAQTAATNAQTAATNANTSATNASASADRAAFLKTDVETLHRMCVAAVDQAATEAVNAANSAAQADATKTDVENLVESLPEDFTDLNNHVNQLSDEIVNKENIPISSTSNNYRLNESDGLCTKNDSYKLHKFVVEVGKHISVTTTDRWMFNTNANVPSSGETHMVGTVHSGSGEADVPIGAGYLIVSAPNGETPTADYVEHTIPVLKAEISANTAAVKYNAEPTLLTSIFQMNNAYWQDANTFKSISYRAGCMTPLTFDHDVVIVCTKVCYISGYLDNVYIGTVSTITVPKDSVLKLYVRRYVENTSATEDVSELTAGLFILNYYSASRYNQLLDSFGGIEMFRTAGFIGDSYTATRLGYGWVDILGNRTGVNVTKYAKSGDDSGAWIADSANGLSVLLADTAKDLYWIALGINDASRYDESSSYLGSVADLSGLYTDYPDTFWGNMGHIIEAIQAHAPNAKIVLYKPIYKAIYRTMTGEYGLPTIRDAINDIAEHYELPVMDAMDDLFFLSDWYARHMDSDISQGNHPSLLLYPGIAKANERLFSKCVQKNANYFMGMNYAT